MKLMTSEEFLQGGTFKTEKPAQPRQSAFSDLFAVPTPGAVGEAGKDVAIGAAKGVGETYNFFSNVPGPLNAIKEVAKPFGVNTTIPEEKLKADNPAQQTGKVLEFATELLFPAKAVATSAAKAGGAVFEGVGKRIASLADETAEGTSAIKERLIDAVTNLDDKTKTALKRTPKEVFQKVVENGRQAMVDDQVITPLENVGEAVIAGLKRLQEQAGEIGARKSALLAENSGEATLDLRTVGAKSGDVFVPNQKLNKIGGTVEQSARQIAELFDKMELDKDDTQLVETFVDALAKLGKNPTLGKLDATIDMLQGKLYTTGRNTAVEVTDRVTGQLRKELGKLNDALKNQVGGEYAELNSRYGQMMDIVNELNAKVGKEGSSAGAFVKRLFSPSDARTKKLFKMLQGFTGEDYFRDARLAKFVMETLGDKRAASILEEIPKSKGGVIDRVVDFAIDKFTDPLKAAERFIEKR